MKLTINIKKRLKSLWIDRVDKIWIFLLLAPWLLLPILGGETIVNLVLPICGLCFFFYYLIIPFFTMAIDSWKSGKFKESVYYLLLTTPIFFLSFIVYIKCRIFLM